MNNGLTLFEVSAEVCWKAGGIYQVIVTKIPFVQKLWGDRYYLLGAWFPWMDYEQELEETGDDILNSPAIVSALNRKRATGAGVHVGRWKVEGRPVVILLDPTILPDEFDDYRSRVEGAAELSVSDEQRLIGLYVCFGYCVEQFFRFLVEEMDPSSLLVHFHEYQTTVALPALKKLSIATLFTAHATVAGRQLAARRLSYHKVAELSAYDRCCAALEAAAARHCDVFTTVSELMGAECKQFLGRVPDRITPNGLSLRDPKRQEDKAVTARIRHRLNRHFFPAVGKEGATAAHGDRIVYFFSSGRYEYSNKGFDLIIKALGRLNRYLRKNKEKMYVVMVFVTDTPFPEGSASPGVVDRLRWLFSSLFYPGRASLFLKPFPFAVRQSSLVRDCLRHGLHNGAADRVKVVYQPAFLRSGDEVFDADYTDLINACDLGIFPSCYEPWGYTPHECLAAGVPAVVSLLSGFGQYIARVCAAPADAGLFLVDPKQKTADEELFAILRNFLAVQKNYTTSSGDLGSLLSWQSLFQEYELAYEAIPAHIPTLTR